MKDEGREPGTKPSNVRLNQMKCLVAPPKTAILSTEYIYTQTSAPSFEMRMWICFFRIGLVSAISNGRKHWLQTSIVPKNEGETLAMGRTASREEPCFFSS